MQAGGAFVQRRGVQGPRPLAALLPALLRPVFDRRPAAVAHIIADWAAIVGADLAARTTPQRLAGGTLTIICAGPDALELQHLSDVLTARINQHVGQPAGHDLVQRLRFMQGPHPAGAAAAPRLPPRPGADQLAAALQALADMPPGPIRDALARLAAAMRQPPL